MSAFVTISRHAKWVSVCYNKLAHESESAFVEKRTQVINFRVR